MKIQQVDSIGNLVAHGYTEFGGYINTKRVLPHIMDGLKPSYRRAIFSTYEIDPGFSSTHEVLGYMSKFHPHSPDGNEDVMLITDKGTIIRLKVEEISVLGRATQGVTLMRTNDGGKVVSIEIINQKNE
jgi:DNA gyrase/topoisomerase IV subunit A